MWNPTDSRPLAVMVPVLGGKICSFEVLFFLGSTVQYRVWLLLRHTTCVMVAQVVGFGSIVTLKKG